MENRHALVVDTRLTLATGTTKREAAFAMVADRPGNHRITLAADRAYDVAEFVADLREYNVTPLWRRTPPIGALPSTAARPATPAMQSVDGCASALRRCLAGPRAPPAFARPITVVWPMSAGCSR
jgi:hypothetical protein